jgi:ATP-dependent Lhr-like helicase
MPSTERAFLAERPLAFSFAPLPSSPVPALATNRPPLDRAGNAAVTVARDWFAARGWTPRPFQLDAWHAQSRGESGLIQVPTGAGKTYAAVMHAIACIAADEANSPTPSGLRLLYVTPLKAVARDIELAIRAPMADLAPRALVECRTGDTAASLRSRQRERLPHALITTPESLSLLLTRENASELLARVHTVVVDEWHELVGSKRGSLAELSLARLRRCASGVRTWALSATLSNTLEAARAACASDAPTIISAESRREIIVDSVLPSDAARLPVAGHMGLAMLPEVVDALDPAVSTLVFTNTRSQAERWFNAILAQRPEWESLMALHHGSIDRDERERVERGLKSGELRIVVATSSLDLGVDFAPVERVFQIGSPKGIGRLVQRAGRAGHRPGASCRVTCVPTHGLELLEIDAARRAIDAGHVEPRTPPPKPLDVLAQHIVTCAMGGGFVADELFDEVRTARSFRDLAREEFDWSLALVERGGGTLAAYPQYHRITPVDGRHVVVEPRIARTHRLNIGTIVSDAAIDVRYLSGRSLGTIEESFVARLRPGQKFVFAGKVVAFSMIRDMTAYVKPAKGRVGAVPVWGGTRLPISEPLGEGVRDSLERVAAGGADSPEAQAARGLIAIQSRHSRVPARDELLIETTESKEGSHAFLFPFEGRLVHAGLASLIALRLSRVRPVTLSIAVNDYGFELLSPDPCPFDTLLDDRVLSADRLLDDALEGMNVSTLARLQFREIARIAGLIVQSHPGARASARQNQASAGLLFDVLSEFDPGHLLLAQARREVLERHFEEGRLARCMSRLASSRRVMVRCERFTPLSLPLVIERQAALVSSQTLLERIEAIRDAWRT